MILLAWSFARDTHFLCRRELEVSICCCSVPSSLLPVAGWNDMLLFEKNSIRAMRTFKESGQFYLARVRIGLATGEMAHDSQKCHFRSQVYWPAFRFSLVQFSSLLLLLLLLLFSSMSRAVYHRRQALLTVTVRFKGYSKGCLKCWLQRPTNKPASDCGVEKTNR